MIFVQQPTEKKRSFYRQTFIFSVRSDVIIYVLSFGKWAGDFE